MNNQRYFLGRTEEQQTFRRVLQSYQPSWWKKNFPTISRLLPSSSQPSDLTQQSQKLPFLLLVHGEGGMGKSSLIWRLRQIAEGTLKTDSAFKGKFNVLFLDWEEQKKLALDLKVGHDHIAPETVLKILYKVMVDAGWGSYFENYRKLVQEIQKVEAKVEKELRGQPNVDLPKEITNLGVKGIALIIRQSTGLEAPGEVIERTINASAEGLYQTRQFIRKALSQKEYDTYAQPHQKLAEALGKDMAELAKRKPLVILLDTYEIVDRCECDYTLRTVIRWSGSRVVWTIAGRADLATSGPRGNVYFQGYLRDFPEDRLSSFEMKEFGSNDIQTYFSKAVPERPITEAQANAIAEFSLGIPFVVSEAAAMWREGKPIQEIVEPVVIELGKITAREQVVKVASERFLVHCFGAKSWERDLQAVYALAMMRRPNVELLKAMLDVTALDRELQLLRERYSFIWVEQVRLDEKLAGFLREYLLTEVRRTSPLVQQVNDRAITWLQLYLENLTHSISDTAERLKDDRIAEAIADLVNHYFWRSEEDGWRYLIPRFVEGWQYNRSWANALLKVVEPFHPSFSKDGQFRLKLCFEGVWLFDNTEASQDLLVELEKLARRTGFGGEGEEERKVILNMQKGLCLSHQGKFEEALQIYLETESRIPDNCFQIKKDLSFAFQSLGFHLGWKDRNPVASKSGRLAFERSILLNRENASSYYGLGVMQWMFEEYDQAVESLTYAINLYKGKFRNALIALGWVYYDQDKYEEACQACQKAIEVDPECAYSYVELANVQRRQGKFSEAIDNHKKAIELAPSDAYVYKEMGKSYHLNYKYDEAISCYQKAIEVDPRYAISYSNLGTVYWVQNKYNEALFYYQKSVEIDPEYATPYANIGGVYSDQGKYNDAAVILQKAIKLDPANDLAHERFGWVCLLQGDLITAKKELELAAEISPSNYHTALELAMVYLLQGNVGEARSEWQKFLMLCPDDYDEWSIATRALCKILVGDTERGMTELEAVTHQAVPSNNFEKPLQYAELLAKSPMRPEQTDRVIAMLRSVVPQ